MRSSEPETVLLLTGVGLTAAVAHRTVAELEPCFRVLTAPVGSGSAAGGGPAYLEIDAERAIALLDLAGVDQAHVVGMSFGGLIAQELAIRHPQRVRSLVLGATSAGGALCAAPEEPVREFLRGLGDLPMEEGLWAAVPYTYAPMTRHRHALRIGEDIARRMRDPLDPRSFRRQRASSQSHDAADRLAAIIAPTLVIHGEEDRLVPLENARKLADGIAGAQLITLPRGAHAFPTDVPDANRELVSFLVARSPRRRRSAGSRSARAGHA